MRFYYFKSTIQCGGMALSLLCMACSSSTVIPATQSKPTYSIATTQAPLEPAFSMTRWVRPPQVLPERRLPVQPAKAYISPVIHYKVKEVSLKEAALILAATTRYRSFCSSSIAEAPITLDTLGTIDEIASEISLLADIQVIVDHSNKEVRFLAVPLKMSSNG